jgi:holliday junction DNA helicase RuvA
MISTLRGIVQQTSSDFVIIEVGGVGLKVAVPASVLQSMGEVGSVALLYTHLIVREDLLALYGFSSEEQRSLFETLLGVQGIGPRLALTVLSFVSPDNLRRAVVHEQPDLLGKIPGVGKKTAEKMIFHLKDKLGSDVLLGGMTSPITDRDTEILSALTALGYSVVEAQAALQAIPKDASPDVEERVRLALRYFVKP